MADGELLNTVQGRADTFAITHRFAKKRASTTKTKGTSTASWSHSRLLPWELARAGLFYKPYPDALDNCECFLCHIKLGGWDADDDPLEEHMKHAPDCGWALSVSIQRKFRAGKTIDADPMSEDCMLGRKHTFGDNWPHESKKGWKPKVKNMVSAGWTYDPTPEETDSVTCMYCDLSLDGWEPKDDPRAEHLKRSPDCPFFSLSNEWSSARSQAKGRKGRERASRGSTASRLSVGSIAASTTSDMPSLLSLGDLDEVVAEDDSILTTASNMTATSTTGKGRKKKAAAKTTRKPTRAKKTAAIEDTVMDAEFSTEVAYPQIQADEEPPTRQTRRAASRTQKAPVVDESLDASQLGVSQSKRPTKRKAATAKPKEPAEDGSLLQPEFETAIHSSMISAPPKTRAKRGTKRTSDGVPKMDSSVILPDERPMEYETTAAKPKRQRTTGRVASKKKKDSAPTREPEPRSSSASDVPQRVSSMPKAGLKSRKGKRLAKVSAAEDEADEGLGVTPVDAAKHDFDVNEMPVEAPEEAVDVDTPDAEVEDINMPEAGVDEVNVPEAEPEDDFDFAASIANPINPYAPITGTPDRDPLEASPAPSTPTPARTGQSLCSSARRPLPTAPSSTTTPAAQQKEPRPHSSPGISDAENRPPSSLPPSARPPLSVQRIPLAAGTPNRQILLSPSKRALGGLTSALPWSPTALENIFAASAVRARLGLGRSSPPAASASASASPSQSQSGREGERDREKAGSLGLRGVDVADPANLDEVVRLLRLRMPPEERAMTVEAWVRWNAALGEERLRTHCERLVMTFEHEAARALSCLEGLDVVD